MRILYFDWNEFTAPDCIEVLGRLGHTVGIYKHLWNCHSVDDLFSERTERALFCADAAGPDGRSYALPRSETPQWDIVFSFNFYPIISEVCRIHGVPYVSWTFDSPYLPVTSATNTNSVNRIYLFDRALCDAMRQQGIETVRYLPLAVNGRRMDEMRRAADALRNGKHYDHDISFVGGLYADKNNFYNAIAAELPVFLKSYVEDVLNLQTAVFGRDLIGDRTIVTDEVITDLRKHIRFEVPEVYHIDYDELIRDMLRTQATEMDRLSLLEVLGRAHPGQIDLYTRWDSPPLSGVRNCGYASYMERMPQVFYGSKVNLNITLRTIRTGIPLRALDVMAAGGFLLSTRQEELAEYFEQGKDLVLAGDPEEFLELASWFLVHDEAREKIAESGRKNVIRQFDYEVQLGKILKDL